MVAASAAAGASRTGRSRGRAMWRTWCSRWSASKLDANWRESYRRVAAVLRGTVRASSAVECMNSVLRMHQSRHRTVTPGDAGPEAAVLELAGVPEGKRRGRAPTSTWGWSYPTYDFWALLKGDFHDRLGRSQGRRRCGRPAPVSSPGPPPREAQTLSSQHLAIWDDAHLYKPQFREVLRLESLIYMIAGIIPKKAEATSGSKVRLRAMESAEWSERPFPAKKKSPAD